MGGSRPRGAGGASPSADVLHVAAPLRTPSDRLARSCASERLQGGGDVALVIEPVEAEADRACSNGRDDASLLQPSTHLFRVGDQDGNDLTGNLLRTLFEADLPDALAERRRKIERSPLHRVCVDRAQKLQCSP